MKRRKNWHALNAMRILDIGKCCSCWASLQHVLTTPFDEVGVDDSTMALLEDGAAETSRSAIMRLGFLAFDRSDKQYAAKAAARGMAKPLIR